MDTIYCTEHNTIEEAAKVIEIRINYVNNKSRKSFFFFLVKGQIKKIWNKNKDIGSEKITKVIQLVG